MEKGIVILVCYGGQVIDRVRVQEVVKRNWKREPVEIKGLSADRNPGRLERFTLVDGEWHRVFQDPLGEGFCFGTRYSGLQLYATTHT